MSDREPLLQVQNLSVSFHTEDRHVQAVKDLSFEIFPGEVLGLVGESGSGKTVTGMSILRLVPSPPGKYDSGRILFGERDILQMAVEDLRTIRGSEISAIFQEPMTALSPLMTIGKQMQELLSLHRPELSDSDARTEVIRWLDQVGIPEPESRLDAYPFEYSGGMRQRVTIAMALMLKPKLIIADEPTTALDVTLQKQVFELLMAMKDDDTSILFITHDMGVVWELCDRVLVMQDAQLVEEGNTKELFAAPTEAYTRKLLRAVPRLTDPMVRETFPTEGLSLLVDAKALKTWFPVKKGILARTVDHVKAVDGVDLKIFEGQTVGLVGESGSGKSTLGRTLLGLVKQTSGSLQCLNANMADADSGGWRRLRREFQMIFQDPYSSLNPRMTVLELLCEAAVYHRLIPKRSPEFAAQWLEEVGLDAGMMHRYPHEFSGGQRQRICIARALALEPKLIICDEAVSALDVTIQAEILDLMLELRDQHNLAYFFISHDLSVVKRISDHVLVMRNGIVVEEGRPDDVISNPQNPYTRDLLAAVPVPE